MLDGLPDRSVARIVKMSAITVLVTMLAAHATAGIPGFPQSSHWPYGRTMTLETWSSGAESLLLYGDGTALTIADASMPTDIVTLGETNIGFMVEHIEIADDGLTAAVTDREKWVTLVDISDRSVPAILGRYEVEDGRGPYGTAFFGDHLAVAVSPIGLWILDVSDPSVPILVGSYLEPGTDFVFDVEVIGTHAFLADDVQGVTAIDISAPSAPTFAGRLAGVAGAWHIAIDGATAYVSTRSAGLYILDLSAAPAITGLGTITPPDFGTFFRSEIIDSGWLAIADDRDGLLVADVSDPAVATIETTFPVDAWDVATDGHIAFTTSLSSDVEPTLFVLDLDTTAPITPPVEIAAMPLHDESLGISVADGIATVAMGNAGVAVIDIADPTDPRTIATVGLGNRDVSSAARVGAVVAYGSYANDLGLVDLSDPAAPVELPDFEIPHPGYAQQVVKIPGLDGVVVAAASAGIRIVDVTDPLAPLEIGFWEPVVGDVSVVGLDGNRIAAAGFNDVWILDSSNPTLPVEITSFTVPSTVLDVVLDGDVVYVACGLSGVYIFDTSDPATPTEIAQFDTLTSAKGVAVDGDRLYIAADTLIGLWVVDVSDPANPTEIEIVDTPGAAHKVRATTDLVVLTDRMAGVRVWGTLTIQTPFFADGFEFGNTGGWSFVLP